MDKKKEEKGSLDNMKSFRQYFEEKCWKGYKQKGYKKKGKRTVPNCVKESIHKHNLGSLTIFDIDDTLFHTTARVGVIDKEGRKAKEISNSEFNTYPWKEGERPDFSEFSNARKFNKESTPIPSMVKKMIGILSNVSKNPKSRVIIITARADFDDKETFLDTFRKHGINIDMVHVERAGNLKVSNTSIADKKAIIVRKYLDTNQFDVARLYDDAEGNIESFNDLQQEYPEVSFEGYLVDEQGKARRV